MPTPTLAASIRHALFQGQAIPAHPLALKANRSFDERRQRALSRYYIAAGAGGLAVGVHTTQFAIRSPKVGLFKPVLELAAETIRNEAPDNFIPIAGLCGSTAQAVAEAEFAQACGYRIGLLSLAALKDASIDQLIDHCRQVAAIIPLMGFYLQPAVGGRILPASFWQRFVEIDRVVAIKIAPFNRYQTLDVLRAVATAGRSKDIALYTGNDDNIVLDLLTNYVFKCDGKPVKLNIVGGLLGHWAVWTQQAVEMLNTCHSLVRQRNPVDHNMLTYAIDVTDANAAFFDAANNFSGCIAGIHDVLRRQGLLEGTWCLDPNEDLSPGQAQEIDRVYAAYPHLNDDHFVESNLDKWLA